MLIEAFRISLKIGFIIAVAILILAVVSVASAFTVENVVISPGDDIVEGESVTAKFSIKITSDLDSGLYTFNPGHSVVLVTALNNPTWTRSTVLDGYASQTATISYDRQVTLTGRDLAYPLGTSEIINISVSGTAPKFETSTRVPIASIHELNNASGIIPGSTVDYLRTIIQKNDLPQAIYLIEKDLTTLSSHISRKQAEGIDVSAAQQMYADARQVTDYVKTLPAAEYPNALISLNAAKYSIFNAEDELEKASVQVEIDKALSRVHDTDQVLKWFEGNESTRNYTGLKDIRSQVQVSAGTISSASKSVYAKDFIDARAKAKTGYEQANKTYYAAIALQGRANDPLTPVKENLWIVIAVIVFAGIAVFFRKKKPEQQEKNDEH